MGCGTDEALALKSHGFVDDQSECLAHGPQAVGVEGFENGVGPGRNFVRFNLLLDSSARCGRLLAVAGHVGSLGWFEHPERSAGPAASFAALDSFPLNLARRPGSAKTSYRKNGTPPPQRPTRRT